jgi:carbonic anhydrase
MRQVFHVCTSPIVQAAWVEGQSLAIYGMIYNLKDGLVNNLVGPISK